LVWQAGSLENYQNRIFGQLLAIIEKNGKSFGKLQALALHAQKAHPKLRQQKTVAVCCQFLATSHITQQR
jgi:hypothetical protein